MSKHRTTAGSWLAEHRKARLWLYGVGLAVVPLLVFYGLVSKDAAPLWLAVLAAVLVAPPNAVAIANLPEDTSRDVPPSR